MLELTEHSPYRNRRAGLSLEPVVDEDIDPRSLDAAPDQLTPPGIIEGIQILLEERLLAQAAVLVRLVQQIVLDLVPFGQRLSASIQALEDRMLLVVGIQIDGDYTELQRQASTVPKERSISNRRRGPCRCIVP